MPGQALITINDNQWAVSIASTYAELTTGLSGVTSLAPGTGMLFILPEKRQVIVDTSKMLFPIDIVFVSESAVVDVASNIEPGYLVTEETPCDMFLEVNAGEAEGVEAGDSVSTATIQQPGFDWSSIISFAISLAILGFVSTMVGGVAGLMGGSSSPKRGELLPQVEKVTVKCPICEKVIEIPEYDRVTKSEALRQHIEKEHTHHSLELLTFDEWLARQHPERAEFKELVDIMRETYGEERMPPEGWDSHWYTEREIFAGRRPPKKEPLYPQAVTKVIPIEKRPRREGDLEYLADSPEFLTQTIEAIGYRNKLDTTFQEAIARAKGLR